MWMLKVTQETIMSFDLLVSIVAIFISLYAIKMAHNANILSKRTQDFVHKPNLKLAAILLNTGSVRVYGGSNVTMANRKDFPLGMYDEIISKQKSITYSFIQKEDKNKEQEPFCLINLCHIDYDEVNTCVVLNAISFSFINSGVKINEMSISEVYSMKSKNECFPIGMQINCTIPITADEFTINIAYAAPDNEAKSLNLPTIAEIATKEKDTSIDLLESPSRAGEIFGFVETGYLYECRTENDELYEFSLIIERDMSNNGRLNPPQIYYGRKAFDRKADAASMRAGMDVIQKRTISKT